MGDVERMAGHLPSWALVLIAALITLRYVGQVLAEASEWWARALGPLGRRWRVRSERRSADVVSADLLVRVEYLAGQVQELRRHDRARSRREDQRDDYLVYDTQWHADLEQWAARNRVTLPPPPHMTFREYLADKGSAGS